MSGSHYRKPPFNVLCLKGSTKRFTFCVGFNLVCSLDYWYILVGKELALDQIVPPRLGGEDLN